MYFAWKRNICSPLTSLIPFFIDAHNDWNCYRYHNHQDKCCNHSRDNDGTGIPTSFNILGENIIVYDSKIDSI